MLKLHYAPNTISVASAIILEHTGQEHELIRVDFKSNQQCSYDYLQLNPKGRVPTLETPDGVLTETPAILEYIAPDLVPEDPFQAAMRRMVPIRMAECAAYLESLLPKLPWDVGALEVVSDAYLYVVLSWLKADGVTPENYPRLMDFQHRMNTHPAVQAVYAEGML